MRAAAHTNTAFLLLPRPAAAGWEKIYALTISYALAVLIERGCMVAWCVICSIPVSQPISCWLGSDIVQAGPGRSAACHHPSQALIDLLTGSCWLHASFIVVHL